MKHTKATRKRMSLAHRGKSPSKETRDKIAQTLKGHHVSNATRDKMSAAKQGKHRSEETKQKLRDYWAIRRMLGLKRKPWTPLRKAQHMRMLKRKKPWLNPKFQAGRAKAVAERHQLALDKAYLRPKRVVRRHRRK